MHSALFVCTALILNSLRSVDTIYTRLHFLCTLYTRLHFLYTRLHYSLHITKRTKCLLTHQILQTSALGETILHRQRHSTVTADNHACYGRPNFRLLLLKSRPPYTTANKRYHRNYNTALTSRVIRANGNYTP